MFYVLSRIADILLAPLNLVLVLLLAGVVIRYGLRWRRLAGVLTGAGLLVLVAGGLLPLGHNMMVMLEQRHPAPAAMPAHIDGIIVLGGSFNLDVSAARESYALNAAADRLVAGVALARRYPQAQLVFSGGMPEPTYTARFLDDIGYDADGVVYEDKSRTTYENLHYSIGRIAPQPGQTWVLVTSAWHMPRAMAVMRSAGWPGTVIAAPTDYRTDGQIRLLPRDLDVHNNMYKTSIALHEGLAWLTYRLTGRIHP